MKQKDIRILNQRKENLAKRLERKQWPEQPNPVLKAQNIHYEMAERIRAIECGELEPFICLRATVVLWMRLMRKCIF